MDDLLLKLTFGLGLLAIGAGQAAAQSGNCAPRQVVLDRLSETYGETRQSMGLGSSGRVMEVFASDASGSWTITVTLPNGMTCLMASGQSFETLAEAIPADDSDA